MIPKNRFAGMISDSQKITSESYDLVLIDGPAGKKGRSGLLSNLHLFRTDVPLLLMTPFEITVSMAREMAYLLNRPLYMFWNFSVISPNPLTVEQVSRIQRAALQVLDSEDLPYLQATLLNQLQL